MRTKIVVGFVIGIGVVLAFVVYSHKWDDVHLKRQADASVNFITHGVQSRENAEIPNAPGTRRNLDTFEKQPPATVIDSPYTSSPNRELLDSPLGEDRKRLVGSLRLDPETSEKLFDILADEFKRTQEWRLANRRSFISQEEESQFRAESDVLAKRLLGENKFQQYDDYRKHRVERSVIDRLNERLSETGSARLYQEVDDLLYAAIKEETSRVPQPRLPEYSSYTEFQAAVKKWREENMKRVYDRAASILLPDQFELLTRIAK